jgi:hypothetical protein
MTSQGRKRDKNQLNFTVSPGTSAQEKYTITHTHTHTQSYGAQKKVLPDQS